MEIYSVLDEMRMRAKIDSYWSQAPGPCPSSKSKGFLATLFLPSLIAQSQRPKYFFKSRSKVANDVHFELECSGLVALFAFGKVKGVLF